jgi:proteasome assembly chaperone (PAC2) family protein
MTGSKVSLDCLKNRKLRRIYSYELWDFVRLEIHASDEIVKASFWEVKKLEHSTRLEILIGNWTAVRKRSIQLLSAPLVH